MTSKIRDRENMPDISNISLNANYAATTKKPVKEPTKRAIMITCQTCNKSYNKQLALKLLADIPLSANFNYENMCLICIKEASNRMKVSYLPDLKESKSALIELTRAYQNAHQQHKALTAKYQKYDYIEQRINHHLMKPDKPSKSGKPKKDKPSLQTKKATALKILASLTEEQRSAILANMAKEQTL